MQQERMTDEQLARLRQAVNIEAARSLLNVVQPLSGVDALAALATAFTTIIEASIPETERLDVLNSLLGGTITEWAAASAAMQGRGATRQ